MLHLLFLHPPGTWCCPPVLASYCPSQDHHSLGYGYNWGDLIIQYISQLTEPFTYKVLFVFESHTAQYQYESVGVTVWLQQILCFTNDTFGKLKNGLNLVAYCLSWQPRNYTTIRHHPTTQHQIVYNTPHETSVRIHWSSLAMAPFRTPPCIA